MRSTSSEAVAAGHAVLAVDDQRRGAFDAAAEHELARALELGLDRGACHRGDEALRIGAVAGVEAGDLLRRRPARAAGCAWSCKARNTAAWVLRARPSDWAA